MFLLASLVVSLLHYVLRVDGSDQIPLTIVNLSGKPMDLFWVDVGSPQRSEVKLTSAPLKNDTETDFLSYYDHEFVAKVVDRQTRKTLSARFTKGPDEEKLYFTVDPDTQSLEVSNVLVNQDMPIAEKIKMIARECALLSGKQLSSCIAGGIYKDVSEVAQRKEQLEKYRDVISSRLRNYTCADDNMETSPAIGTHSVTLADKDYNVSTLHNMTHSQIYVVENFITDEECDVLMKHGGPRLRRATVAAEDGTSVVSENRKAQQASYDIKQTSRGKDRTDDPLWPLFTRILNMTNVHTGLDLQPPGQEHFTIIQYNPNDQYTPHCDGACDNDKHISTGRVATTVLYCKVPTRGGATSFTKADVFVKPKKNSAAFFSYYGLDGIMDDGYTEHSGCPVLEGDKWITALWMRKGVSEDNPWDFYDPMGIPILDENSDNFDEEEE